MSSVHVALCEKWPVVMVNKTIHNFVVLPRAHAQRGEVIGSVVVVVVSTKIARSRILGEFASVHCSYGVRNQKKMQGCPKDHESCTSCFLLVTPISHTHINDLPMHALR